MGQKRFKNYQVKDHEYFLIGMKGLIPNYLDDLKAKIENAGYDNLYRFLRDKTREHYSAKSIADMAGVSVYTINVWQDRIGLKRQKAGGSPKKWKREKAETA